jgi:L-asparaginase
MSTKKKICLVFTGGTIGMQMDPVSKVLKPASDALALLKEVPELQSFVDLDVEHVMNIDSSNMQPKHWTLIAERIHKLYKKYDGFVVAHGTDTMAYTASALSYALPGLGKPIVFTGSLIPMSEVGSDARNNLVYACMTATLNIAEVCVVLANKILRANRVKKHHESFVAAFHSPNYPALGELGRPIIIHEWCKKRHDKTPKLKANFDPKISYLKLFPGFDPYILAAAKKRGVKGIVLEGFGPGNVPSIENSIIPEIQDATNKGIPVLITTQMEKGATSLEAYEAGLRAKKAGAISAKDMTSEAAVTKLMWALGQGLNLKKIKSLLEKNQAGELSEGI